MKAPIYRNFQNTALLLLAGVATGCANVGTNGYDSFPESAIGTYTASAEAAQALDDYLCPENEEPNVFPHNYDAPRDGYDVYTVCRSKSSQTKIAILGEPRDAEQVCVFPIYRYDESRIYYKTLTPQCMGVADSGMFADFKDIQNWNAVIITRGQDRLQMQECIVTKDDTHCPNYSYGRFR